MCVQQCAAVQAGADQRWRCRLQELLSCRCGPRCRRAGPTPSGPVYGPAAQLAGPRWNLQPWGDGSRKSPIKARPWTPSKPNAAVRKALMQFCSDFLTLESLQLLAPRVASCPTPLSQRTQGQTRRVTMMRSQSVTASGSSRRSRQSHVPGPRI